MFNFNKICIVFILQIVEQPVLDIKVSYYTQSRSYISTFIHGGGHSVIRRVPQLTNGLPVLAPARGGGGHLIYVGEPLCDVPLSPLDKGQRLVNTEDGEDRLLLTLLNFNLYLDLRGVQLSHGLHIAGLTP